jgi:hypothetical protein
MAESHSIASLRRRLKAIDAELLRLTGRQFYLRQILNVRRAMATIRHLKGLPFASRLDKLMRTGPPDRWQNRGCPGTFRDAWLTRRWREAILEEKRRS